MYKAVLIAGNGKTFTEYGEERSIEKMWEKIPEVAEQVKDVIPVIVKHLGGDTIKQKVVSVPGTLEEEQPELIGKNLLNTMKFISKNQAFIQEWLAPCACCKH